MSTALDDIKRLLPNLTRGEKAQLLQAVAGEVGIVRTRIPVRVLEQYRRLGMSEAALLENYPTLRVQDLAGRRRGRLSGPALRERELPTGPWSRSCAGSATTC